MLRLALVLAALALAPVISGCEWGCSFDTETFEDERAVVRADVGAVPDTMTVAFVRGWPIELSASTSVGLAEAFGATDDGTVSLSYSAEGLVIGRDRPRPRLAMTAVGDTAYVYVEGTLDAGLFTQACSPPLESLRVDVDGLRVPEGVEAVCIVAVWQGDLEGRAAALRQHAAARRAARPITT